MTFKDLKFEKKSFGGFGSKTIIGKYVLSVQCGSGTYCSPRMDCDKIEDYGSFEIAVWDDGGDEAWRTKYFYTSEIDDVKGWVSRDEIDELIIRILQEKNK